MGVAYYQGHAQDQGTKFLRASALPRGGLVYIQSMSRPTRRAFIKSLPELKNPVVLSV